MDWSVFAMKNKVGSCALYFSSNENSPSLLRLKLASSWVDAAFSCIKLMSEDLEA